jgi:predicted enzyme related to lactoylglutathione lyase
LSERETYPAGVPCWVETLQPDPRAALDFYGQLLGWEFGDPGPMPGALRGEYYVARVKGRDVAGIGSLPDLGGPAVPLWNTYIRVESANEAVATAQAAGGKLLIGPLEALPAGRLAVLVDPVGAAFCVWEARGREGAQLVNEPRTWAMSSLHTTDAESAKAFYGSVFGWHPEAIGSPETQMILWRLPGYVGEETQQPIPRDVAAVMAPTGDAAAPIPPHWNVNFYVDGVDATVAHATSLGGQVIVPPLDTPGFRSAALTDPQGAAFSISQLTVSP